MLKCWQPYALPERRVKGGGKLDHWGAVMVYHLMLSVIGDVHANGSRKESRLATAEVVEISRKPEVTGVG